MIRGDSFARSRHGPEGRHAGGGCDAMEILSRVRWKNGNSDGGARATIDLYGGESK